MVNKTQTTDPLIRLSDATLTFGARTLWSGLTAEVRAGEFIAVLGPNGTGKSTFLKALLGLIPLTSGQIRIAGQRPGQDNNHIGYIPQQKSFDRSLPIRGRDLVALGLNGTQFGFMRNQRATDALVSEVITSVEAGGYADMPIGLLSGGEQQRLRIAQALVSRPRVLLCDEPLLSLDVTSQGIVTSLLDTYRKRENAAIIFVTHEINPVLPYVDRVLYLANGQWIINTPSNVLKTETLTGLYGSHVEVLNVRGRLLVIGGDDVAQATDTEAHHGENE